MKQFLILSLLVVAGCATTAPQTAQLLRAPPNLPMHALIENVAFIKQTDYYCGPATLTMAIRWAGKDVNVDEIGRAVFTPGMKGSLQQDMITASRRQGLMAVQIEGLESLLREVAAGHPVIVFENLALSWLPRWHYAVVIGYDIKEKKVIMHSGTEAFKHWDLATFERSWQYANYWGLVILQPGQLSAAADELAHLRAAAGLESLDQASAAEISYRSILQKWPQSLGALIGMGNLEFKKENYRASVNYLRRATQHHPSSIAARHNLAVAEAKAGRKPNHVGTPLGLSRPAQARP